MIYVCEKQHGHATMVGAATCNLSAGSVNLDDATHYIDKESS